MSLQKNKNASLDIKILQKVVIDKSHDFVWNVDCSLLAPYVTKVN